MNTLKTTALFVSSSLFLTTAFANEQPNAQDLVGKTYGGAHILHINTDNDRLITANPYSSIDHGSGFGGELGYRWSETTEFRFSASKINLVNEYEGFKEPNSSSMGVDALYFPTKQNFYVLGGLDYLDIVNTQASLDLGAGYRHYLSEKAALYIEAKAHYQLSEHFKDTSAKVGFIYFFGESSKSRPSQKVAQVNLDSDNDGVLDKNDRCTDTPMGDKVDRFGCTIKTMEKDSDRDGILDKNDQCANTPMSDKVDSKGCTIFNKEKVRMELLVNFDNNKSVVKNEYMAEVEKAANFLNLYPHTSLVIEGHTSKVGSRAYNQKISQQRAEAILAVLVNKYSIAASRLSAVGYGEDRLLNNENTTQAHTQNRRIEAKVETMKKMAVKR